MWFLVSVVRGNKFYEPDSVTGNLVLLSDTTDTVIAGRSTGSGGYAFEMRRGNEGYVVCNYPGVHPRDSLVGKFKALAAQLGAVQMTA